MLFKTIQPMLLTMGNTSFDDDNYIFDIKWDGWRIILHKKGNRVEAYTKNGNCVTKQFPELKQIAQAIQSETAIIDCEGICIKDGRPHFENFCYRGRLKDKIKITAATKTHPATFVAFDVLYTYKDHTGEPLMDRKLRLQEMITPNEIITPTVFVEGQGKALSQLTIEKDLEGIVAKKKDSKYITGTRSTEWIKIKNFKLIDTVILGYRTEPHFALVVGVHFPTVKNKPVAVVEWRFSAEEKKAFLEIAKQLHVKKDITTQWIEPRLCCRIQYRDRSDMHHLREVSFKGFLFDKKPEECNWIA